MKVNTGPVGASQMSGSLLGVVGSHNRYGLYYRNHTVPVNPQSSRQQAVRQALASLAERWSSTLTAAQRAAWKLYADSVQVLDIFGNPINLTGFQMYLRSNTVISQVGGALVDDGPTVFSLPDIDTTFAITASEASQEISVTFDNTLDWANEDDAYMAVYQGQPQLGSRTFFGGPWRYMDKVAGDAATPPTSPDAQAVAFAIAETQAQWCYARILRADGRLSNPFRTSIAVGA